MPDMHSRVKRILSNFTVRPLLFLCCLMSADLCAAQWSGEESIAGGYIDRNVAGMGFDNQRGRLFSFWDGNLGAEKSGGGFSVRNFQGPTSARRGPTSVKYFTMRHNSSGRGIVAYTSSDKVYVGSLPVGGSVIQSPRLLGSTVSSNPGRLVDVHLTENNLAAVIWIGSDRRPRAAIGEISDSIGFTPASIFTLDTPPATSAGGVFIARDSDGGAFAFWRKDSTYRQAYFNPGLGYFGTPTTVEMLIPSGPSPASGKSSRGTILNLELGANLFGDTALAYSVYTSSPTGVQPFNSVSIVFAYRKRGELLGSQLAYSGINADNVEETAPQVAVLPDGRAVVAWIKSTYVANFCGSSGEGAFIRGAQIVRTAISDIEGSSWEALVDNEFDGRLNAVSSPLELAVAKDRVVVGFKKLLFPTTCSDSARSAEFGLIRALWPSDKPTFADTGSPIRIPGSGSETADNLAALGVADSGSVGVLVSRRISNLDVPRLIFWSSGDDNRSEFPGSGGGEDLCPEDPLKTIPGLCGCGNPELDANRDLIVDCGTPKTFSRNVRPRIAQVTNTGKGRLNLRMEKLVGTGLSYQIRISGPGRFSRVVRAKGAKVNISKLPRGVSKVSFRLSKAQGGSTVYSRWSSVRSVRVR